MNESDSPPCPARVVRVESPDGWMATGWDEVRRVLSDPVFSRALAVGRTPGAHRRETFLIDMDPPAHQRIRRLAVPAFTHRRARALTPRVDGLARDLVAAMAAAGPPADLVRDLSLPLPITVIGELLGVPPQDRDRFQGWSDAFLSSTAFTREEIETAHAHLDGYLSELIARRRVEPSDDLLSELVRARDENGGLTEPELLDLGVGLLVAGYETTANQLTTIVHTLLTRRDLWDRLVASPALLPTAVDELMRCVPLGSDRGMPRVAVRDVELGGVLVRAGETVYASRPLANKDATVFDDPERIVLDRPDNPHLAFGHGIHHCLGAHLARLELRAALGALTARLPEARIAVPETDLQWKTGLSVRGLHALPLTWEDDTR
ncbi:cytochrome P450 [Actinomadura harenae]|uniref:Cytochrome P450 n=1 Tax=Actinomadura harenae TaxID=2483351 RepID=A0A3M2M2P3_9ACTN|nr:cytochrome P450 [Actinomadura harenae]RMI43672.1 cytochrome P450 [Actinomadura harenae]